jgi:hypothetical protein
MKLHVSGFLRANSAASASKLLQRLGTLLELNLETLPIEPYWKDPALMRFHGELELDDRPPRDAFFETVARFAKLSPRISVTPPDESEPWDFSGDMNQTSIVGIELVSFSVRSK